MPHIASSMGFGAIYDSQYIYLLYNCIDTGSLTYFSATTIVLLMSSSSYTNSRKFPPLVCE